MADRRNIRGKVLLKGQIECLSPIHVGNGRSDRTDLDLMTDVNGQPFIPATSFVGILQHVCKRDLSTEPGDSFWGYAKDEDGHQSMLCCSDLTCVPGESPQIVVRDGVRICTKTGLPDDTGKFDFELIERGTRFVFTLEVTYKEPDETIVKQMVRSIHDLLANEGVQIGARTNSGFGQIRLLEADTRIYAFDFTRKQDVFHWLVGNMEGNAISVEELGESLYLPDRHFHITAVLRLDNSLLIRSYGTQPRMPDTTQLESAGDWVIPGSSLKGAIRARAERIVKTLGLDAKDIITQLFGYVGTEDRSQDGRRGRIRVREINLAKVDFATEQQTRIRIDRFTGGVIEGGLFDSMPIFVGSDSAGLVTLHIDVLCCHPHEAGLLLLVLKDLWTGDLAIGGEKSIGRGVFQGVCAEILWDGEKIFIEEDLGKLSSDVRGKLQGFVDALAEEST